jgi:hypothetical protein
MLPEIHRDEQKAARSPDRAAPTPTGYQETLVRTMFSTTALTQFMKTRSHQTPRRFTLFNPCVNLIANHAGDLILFPRKPE